MPGESFRERMSRLHLLQPNGSPLPAAGGIKASDLAAFKPTASPAEVDVAAMVDAQLRRLAEIIAKESAIEHAAKNDPAILPYLSKAGDPDWKPHPWVIDAVHQALKQGIQLEINRRASRVDFQ